MSKSMRNMIGNISSQLYNKIKSFYISISRPPPSLYYCNPSLRNTDVVDNITSEMGLLMVRCNTIIIGFKDLLPLYDKIMFSPYYMIKISSFLETRTCDDGNWYSYHILIYTASICFRKRTILILC